MKILSTNQVKEADAYTIANKPIASIDLMECASLALANWLVDKFDVEKEVWIFCGTGNNGGDGLAIARMLCEREYDVKVFVVDPRKKVSEDFSVNYARLLPLLKVVSIEKAVEVPAIPDHVIIVDGLFGSGLSRKVEKIHADVIEAINRSKGTTVAIDIPSGLSGEGLLFGEVVVKADYTIAFQVPKLAFVIQDSGKFVGNLHIVDIGLDAPFIMQCETDYFVITKKMIQSFILPREKYAHKGSYGRGLLIVGSYGKMGAAVLSGLAAMRSGLGLLTIHSPRCGYEILQMSIPEAMVSVDPTQFCFGEVPDLSKYTAIGIGPGLDQKAKTVKALKKLLDQTTKPVVLDADAINIIANHRDLLPIVPQGSILTPHHREFERLAGLWKDGFQRLSIQKEFSIKHKVLVVFKDPYTAISTPEGKVYFNTNGNSGMATAGSGDVLTGLITGFLTQGYSSLEAAQLGVYVHGLAGDFVANHKGMMGMIASDIIDSIPEALLSLS